MYISKKRRFFMTMHGLPLYVVTCKDVYPFSTLRSVIRLKNRAVLRTTEELQLQHSGVCAWLLQPRNTSQPSKSTSRAFEMSRNRGRGAAAPSCMVCQQGNKSGCSQTREKVDLKLQFTWDKNGRFSVLREASTIYPQFWSVQNNRHLSLAHKVVLSEERDQKSGDGA